MRNGMESWSEKKNFCFLLKNEWWFPSLIFLLDIAEELEGPASLQIRPWSPFNQKTMELIVFDQRRRFTNFYLNLFLKHFVKRKKSSFRGVCNSCKANPQLKLLLCKNVLGSLRKGFHLQNCLGRKMDKVAKIWL